MRKPEFVYVTYIETTPEKLWTALTDPEITKEYWGRRSNRSDWKPGSDWQHVGYDDPTDIAVAGKVIESQPPHLLVLSWPEPIDAGDPDKISQVTFAIEEYRGSVKLTVTHRDLSEEALRNITAGWPAILSSLKSLLETGASLPMTRQRWKKNG
jgi:uncharacterized protein YndB with AHSA1/START domain